MKKKILIVFLICCMLFGVPSAAMAAELYPPPEDGWSFYYIFRNNSSLPAYNHCDKCNSSPYVVLYFTEKYTGSITQPIYFDLDDSGFVSNILIPTTGTQYNSMFRLSSIFTDSSGNSYWGFHQTLSYSSYEVLDNGYVSFVLSTPILVSDVVDSSYHDVLVYGTDENFPPAPPLVNLTEELIQKTPEALDLDGKLKILVPFGISCLALLISLPLLLKVLRRFLG